MIDAYKKSLISLGQLSHTSYAIIPNKKLKKDYINKQRKS